MLLKSHKRQAHSDKIPPNHLAISRRSNCFILLTSLTFLSSIKRMSWLTTFTATNFLTD
jgi:hypothetical protein